MGARAGSTTSRLIDVLLEYPALDTRTVTTRLGVSDQAAREALDRLTEAEVLHEITGSKRDRAWTATNVMNELEGLNMRLRGA